jgi:SagB-type dehydrogenase family enzyme
MHSRRVRYVLNVLLLMAAIVALLSGIVVDQLDLNDFAPHRWGGYVLAVLVVIHVGLRWRWFLPTRGGQRQRTERLPAPPIDDRAGAVDRAGAAPEARDLAPVGVEQPLGSDGTVGSDGTHAHGERPGTAHPTRRVALTAMGAGAVGAVAGWAANSRLSASPYPGGDVGLFYHRESSLGLGALLSNVVDWGRRPAPYLRVGDEAVVTLPPVGSAPAMSVAQALEQRRSLREYADRALTAEELAWVIHAATGITSPQGLRTAPSAGALYPLETYVAVNRVDGIDPGLYHVDVRAQALEPVRSGSVAGDLMVAGLGQGFLRSAPVVIVLTGLFQRSRWKYRERHYRYVCWEGGHVTQNVYLAAEAAGLGACMVGAFLDGMVNDLVGADGRTEAALGLIALGPR